MNNRELYPEGFEQERKAFLAQMEDFLDRNEPQAALNLARERLIRSPGDPDARIGICRAWLQQGKIGETGEMIAEVEEIIANLSQIYACMGDVFVKKGLEDSAEMFYQRSMILNPGVHWVRDTLERLKGIEEPHEEEPHEEEPHGADAEVKTEEDAGIPPDFQTATLAELYIRQGHLRPAEELLVKIVGQEPHNEKAAGLLQEVHDRMLAEATKERHAGIVAELSRWLDHIDRARGHAA
jgi:tetratricopeptide (TPR) repeat protein